MENLANDHKVWWLQIWQSASFRILVLMALLLAVYTPVRRAGFIWDDDDHLTSNPAMTSPHGLRMIWSSLAVSRYYPLTLTTFWVEHRLWGLNPLPYHTVNVVLHALNAALLFLLLRRLRIRGAWFAALVWALHPLCVESVAWVTELKNVQSGFFFFLTLLAYLHFEEQPKISYYIVMLLGAAAAMLSKSSAVVLPAVLLLLIWWQRGAWRKIDWLRVAPLFVGGMGMAFWTIREQKFQISRADASHEVVLNFLQRWLLAGRAVWFYLGKIFWPADLSFLYPHWNVDSHSFAAWVPLLVLCCTAIALFYFRQRPWVRAGLLAGGFFVVVLLPMLGFIDLFFFRYSYVADHFQYLACLGPIVLVTAAGAQWIRWRWVRGIIGAVLLLVLSGSTWGYTHVFENLVVLWQDVLNKNPDSWLAHNNLGAVYASLNDFPNAAQEYAAAIHLKPDFAEAHSNLGNTLVRQGKLQNAVSEYATALQYDPNLAGVYYNLGNLSVLQGLWPEAVDNYQAALRIRPDFPEARHNLELALKKNQATK